MIYAHAYTAEIVHEMYQQLVKDVEVNEFRMLDTLHHFTAGMKSVFTQETWDSLNLIR